MSIVVGKHLADSFKDYDVSGMGLCVSYELELNHPTVSSAIQCV